MELFELTALQLSRLLQKREAGAVEVVAAF